MDNNFIQTLKALVDIDIRDEDLRERLLENLNDDLEIGTFNLEKYLTYYENFGPLGKTQLDVWKTDRTLQKFYKSMGVILAVSKFKNSIKKFSC